jgi:Uma2 family endonuclease
MSLPEIVLPETKPETEWVRGRALQKVSPTYWHAVLQTLIAAALHSWAEAGGYGRVGTEWRFRVTPPEGRTRPLVPDIAYLSYETIPADATPDVFQVPLAAPTVAVEVLSPDDRPRDVADKINTYLAAGSVAVIVVDTDGETFTIHERTGKATLRRGDTFGHPVLRGLTLDLTTLFDRVRR